MRQDLLRGSYLQADETVVPVQMHDKRGADHQATYGNTASREGRRYSSFAWDEGARVRKNSWASGKASYKLTDIRPTIHRWAEVSACRLLGTRSA